MFRGVMRAMHKDRGHTYVDHMMMTYYTIMFIVGIGWIFDAFTPSDTHLMQSAVGTGLFGFAMVLFAPMGAVARWLGTRDAECIALLGLAAATLLNGLLLIVSGGILSGLRLTAGPFIMVAYALLNRRYVLSKRDLERIARYGDDGEPSGGA